MGDHLHLHQSAAGSFFGGGDHVLPVGHSFAGFVYRPPTAACLGQAYPQALREEWKYMAAGLCGVTLYFLFQNIALTYTLAANVSVLVSVAPMFTALVARSIFKEKLKANFFLGFTAAMAGIILIAFNGSMVLKLNPLGDLLSSWQRGCGHVTLC